MKKIIFLLISAALSNVLDLSCAEQKSNLREVSSSAIRSLNKTSSTEKDKIKNLILSNDTSALARILNKQNINEPIYLETTPLMAAIIYLNQETIPFLINLGANVNQITNDGIHKQNVTPLVHLLFQEHNARHWKQLDKKTIDNIKQIAGILFKAGADVTLGEIEAHKLGFVNPFEAMGKNPNYAVVRSAYEEHRDVVAKEISDTVPEIKLFPPGILGIIRSLV